VLVRRASDLMPLFATVTATRAADGLWTVEGAAPLGKVRVPDGEDYIEFMLYSQAPTREVMLTKHHICLEVPDAAKAGAQLQSRPFPAGLKAPDAMKIGVNGKRQINYYDPDGTRVEIMEPGTFDGKPVPPSKAPPPPPLPPYQPVTAAVPGK
jgi:lactoylglutathione lyase